MSTEAHGPTARTEEKRTDAASDRTQAVFGIDAAGREHRWSRGDDEIVVTDGGDVVHREPVTDTDAMTLIANETGREFDVPATVGEWVQFVDDEVAWAGTWLDAGNAGEAVRRHDAARAEVDG